MCSRKATQTNRCLQPDTSLGRQGQFQQNRAPQIRDENVKPAGQNETVQVQACVQVEIGRLRQSLLRTMARRWKVQGHARLAVPGQVPGLSRLGISRSASLAQGAPSYDVVHSVIGNCPRRLARLSNQLRHTFPNWNRRTQGCRDGTQHHAESRFLPRSQLTRQVRGTRLVETPRDHDSLNSLIHQPLGRSSLLLLLCPFVLDCFCSQSPHLTALLKIPRTAPAKSLPDSPCGNTGRPFFSHMGSFLRYSRHASGGP